MRTPDDAFITSKTSADIITHLYREQKKVNSKFSLQYICKHSGISSKGRLGDLMAETSYEIKTIGKMEEVNMEVSFQFEALPNANGNCTFHVFGIVTRYLN